MRRSKLCGLVASLCVLGWGPSAFSQDVVGSWGVGAFVGYNRSLFKLDQWYQDGKTPVGGAFIYVVN